MTEDEREMYRVTGYGSLEEDHARLTAELAAAQSRIAELEALLDQSRDVLGQWFTICNDLPANPIWNGLKEIAVVNSKINQADVPSLLTDARFELAKAEAGNARLRAALDASIELLAEWCMAVERDPTWDGWDEYYKDAAYRPGPLRGMIDAAIAARRGE